MSSGRVVEDGVASMTTGSKKDEDKRRQMIINILGIGGSMSGHPVVTTMLAKYVKTHVQSVDKTAYRLDFLRMLCLNRLSK
ncbi:virion protein [Suid betaherpesvirus 2]|uniref:Small capsomere-interacting protein n=1 Tax=Suid betaherpesvirus 2 TaxID=1608255 RepID=U3GPJ8_9BETA|nr:virion protein [Suid betaherpesvirus 2]AGT99226.1 virion protein [Suid betaherpesvirus 2]